jgi:hypothetical protein
MGLMQTCINQALINLKCKGIVKNTVIDFRISIVLTILILSVLLHNCNESDIQVVEKQVERITSLEYPEIFYSFLLDTRGKDSNGVYLARALQYYKPDGSFISLPLPEVFESLDSIGKSKWINNVKEFAQSRGFGHEDAVRYYLESCRPVSHIFSQLNISEVYSNPRLGKFIIFKLDNQDKLIFLEDPELIMNSSWQYDFKRFKKVADNWYLKEKNNSK